MNPLENVEIKVGLFPETIYITKVSKRNPDRILHKKEIPEEVLEQIAYRYLVSEHEKTGDFSTVFGRDDEDSKYEVIVKKKIKKGRGFKRCSDQYASDDLGHNRPM